jgi:hypothetical protein
MKASPGSMIIPTCSLQLLSPLSLEHVGQIVSARVLGGIPFVGREDYIRDEVPAIYSESEVLGTRFILMGEPDDEGFYLEADGADLIPNMSAKQIENALLDISPLVAHLLKEVEGLTVSIEPLRYE